MAIHEWRITARLRLVVSGCLLVSFTSVCAAAAEDAVLPFGSVPEGGALSDMVGAMLFGAPTIQKAGAKKFYIFKFNGTTNAADAGDVKFNIIEEDGAADDQLYEAVVDCDPDLAQNTNFRAEVDFSMRCTAGGLIIPTANDLKVKLFDPTTNQQICKDAPVAVTTENDDDAADKTIAIENVNSGNNIQTKYLVQCVDEVSFNDYACYQIKHKLTKGQSGTIANQVEAAGTFEKCKAKFLCVPTDKPGSAISDPNLQYCCHQCKGGKPTVPFTVTDQFVAGSVTTKKLKLICNRCDKSLME